MKTLEQINDEFLQAASEINQYTEYMELQEKCLKQSLKVVDLKILSESKEYLKQHRESVEGKLEWAKKEWQKISQSRTFHYELLGRIIAAILTRKEGVPYFCATRLVKHTFQIDEVNRPFYRVISFVTANKGDLEALLFDRLSATMYPYYLNNSPIMKPLPRELTSKSGLEDMIRRELEAREATNLYIVTENDIPSLNGFPKTENQSKLTNFPFHYVSVILEKMIEMRYHKNGAELTEGEIEQIISEFCESLKQITGVAM